MKKAKICLLNPIKMANNIYPPLNLASISSYLKKYGKNLYDIKLVDINFTDDYIGDIIKFNPGILGFTTLSPFILDIYKISDQIKCINKNIIQIFGGVHASIDPSRVLKMSSADVVVIGEGEETFRELVDCCIENGNRIDFNNLSSINGIAYMDNGCIKINKPRSLISDLDMIPHPDRQLINRAYYKKFHIMRGMSTNGIHMISGSRGCPYQCIFCCVNVVGRNKPRHHSPGYIVDEIERLVLEYKARWLFFSDDTFFIDKAGVIEMCNLMIEKDLSRKVKWEVQVRSNLVKKEDLPILRLMKKAGCEQIDYGFESGNQRVLALIKGKGITMEDNQRAIDLTNKAGIKVLGTFILGTPTETYEELLDTKEFILKNYKRINRFQASCMIPYPGTKVYDLSVEKGLIGHDYYEELKKEKDNKIEHGIRVICDTISASKVLELRKELDILSFRKVSIGDKFRWLVFNLIYNYRGMIVGIRWLIGRFLKKER